MANVIVFGAGGFIGSHLVKRLRDEGHWVRGVDRKFPEFSEHAASDFVIADLRRPESVVACLDREFDEVYQLAAEMGGAGYIFTGAHDMEIMANSARINLNVVEAAVERRVGRLFFSSSACVYRQTEQRDPLTSICSESMAYPADPDSEYGWEKLFSERIFSTAGRCSGLPIRIGRFHNIFGPEGAWCSGREKAPAAICRKVAEASNGGEIQIWGDGSQSRSFLYIDECLEGVLRLMHSDIQEPINIGSDERVTIRALAEMIIEVSGKRLSIRAVPGPVGVSGRSSDNRMIESRLGWKPSARLCDGLVRTYAWIANQVEFHKVAH